MNNRFWIDLLPGTSPNTRLAGRLRYEQCCIFPVLTALLGVRVVLLGNLAHLGAVLVAGDRLRVLDVLPLRHTRSLAAVYGSAASSYIENRTLLIMYSTQSGCA